MADFARNDLAALRGEAKVWAVGERVQARLVDSGLNLAGHFDVPHSIHGIVPLVGQVLMKMDLGLGPRGTAELHLYYNHPVSGAAYAPMSQQVLPLDEGWRRKCIDLAWPTPRTPEVVGGPMSTLPTLIREYLFISIFRACALSLASENASRLASMQRAEKNIDDLLVDLDTRFNRFRQSQIDEELFDVIAGFEALSKRKVKRG